MSFLSYFIVKEMDPMEHNLQMHGLFSDKQIPLLSVHEKSTNTFNTNTNTNKLIKKQINLNWKKKTFLS